MSSASCYRWFKHLRAVLPPVGTIASFALARPLAAQGPEGRLSFDFGTGGFHGIGAGPRSVRSGFSFAAGLSARVRSSERHKLLVALNASAFHATDREDCVLAENGKSDPSNSCLREFPSTGAVGLLLGFEHRLSHAVSMRVFAGPSLYATFSPRVEKAKPGFVSRADLVVPAYSRVAFVLWGEVGVVPFETTPTGNRQCRSPSSPPERRCCWELASGCINMNWIQCGGCMCLDMTRTHRST